MTSIQHPLPDSQPRVQVSGSHLPGQPSQCPPVLAAPGVSSSPPSIPPEAGRTTSWQPAWSPRWSPPSRRRAQGRACAEDRLRTQVSTTRPQCAGPLMRSSPAPMAAAAIPAAGLAASVTVQPRPSPVVSSPPQASPAQVRGGRTASAVLGQSGLPCAS